MIYNLSLKLISDQHSQCHIRPYNLMMREIFLAMMCHARSKVVCILYTVWGLRVTRNVSLNENKKYLFSLHSAVSGHVIVITGIPYGSSKGWFLIRFTEAASKRQALHFNVRFDPYFVVVRNNMNENGVYVLLYHSISKLCQWLFSEIWSLFLSRFGTEERTGGFPFVLDQQFKLAIALTPKEFLFAVDGVFFASFAYRSGHGIEKLNGFKMGTNYGMYLEITSVDHVQMESSDCDGFEEYSHPDFEIM